MNTLETHVLEIIGENTASPDVFTDDPTGMAQIRESLNDAIQEISMLSGGYTKNYHLPLRANCGFYRLKFTRDHFGWVTDAWLVGQKRRLEHTSLIRLNAFNPRWMKNSGLPHSYFQVGKNILGLWPKTSSDIDILEITSVVIPDRYKLDTDKIKLRESYKWGAVHFAVSEFYASRGDAKTSKYHHEIYIEKLGAIVGYQLSAERKAFYQTNKEYWPKSTD